MPPTAAPPGGAYNPGMMAPAGVAPPHVQAEPQAPPIDEALMQNGEMVKGALSNILQRCAGHYASNPGEQRKIADTQKKINVLFDALSNGKVSHEVVAKLQECSAAASAGDFQRGLGVYTALTREHFQEIQPWGPALSRMLN